LRQSNVKTFFKANIHLAWRQCVKTFFRSSCKVKKNKLERLPLVGIFSA
jgi:hypothetical protein